MKPDGSEYAVKLWYSVSLLWRTQAALKRLLYGGHRLTQQAGSKLVQ